MPRFAAVSRERHGNKKWQRFKNYAFAAADATMPIVGAEIGRAALAMPCAFVPQQEAGRYTLVAALSPVPGRNMFVGPDGSWLGPYVPFWFRVYPFRVLPAPGLDQPVLCVDEDSTLIVDRNAAGEDFFDAAGNLSPALKPVFDALMHVERNRKVTDLAVAALAQAGVIRPWPIKLKTDQGEQAVGGLHRVDEAALRALPDEAFLKLRKAAALPIAFAQMLSVGQLGVFALLARIHQQAAPPQPSAAALPETIDSLLENLKDDMVRFN